MTTALSPLPLPLVALAPPPSSVASIFDVWYAGKSATTRRAYQCDLRLFARFLSAQLGVPLTPVAALDHLFAADSPTAHGLVLRFRAALLERHLSAASINRNLATLRSVSKLARMLGVIPGG